MDIVALALLDYLITTIEIVDAIEKKHLAVKEQRFDDASIFRSEENILKKSIATIDQLKALRDKLTQQSCETFPKINYGIESLNDIPIQGMEWSQEKVERVKQFVKEVADKRTPEEKAHIETMGELYKQQDRLRNLIKKRREEIQKSSNQQHPSSKAVILRELKRFESWL